MSPVTMTYQHFVGSYVGSDPAPTDASNQHTNRYTNVAAIWHSTTAGIAMEFSIISEILKFWVIGLDQSEVMRPMKPP